MRLPLIRGYFMGVQYTYNPHVGDILKQEFIDEIGISQNDLARSINVPPNRIHLIVKGLRSVTADTDVRLCKFFDLSEGYFLRLQATHNIMEIKRKKHAEIDRIIPYSLKTPCA